MSNTGHHTHENQDGAHRAYHTARMMGGVSTIAVLAVVNPLTLFVTIPTSMVASLSQNGISDMTSTIEVEQDKALSKVRGKEYDILPAIKSGFIDGLRGPFFKAVGYSGMIVGGALDGMRQGALAVTAPIRIRSSRKNDDLSFMHTWRAVCYDVGIFHYSNEHDLRFDDQDATFSRSKSFVPSHREQAKKRGLNHLRYRRGHRVK